MLSDFNAAAPQYEQALPAFAVEWLQGVVDSVRSGEMKLTAVEANAYESERPEGDGVYALTLRLVVPTPRFLCGCVSMAGPDGEPLACAYPPGHDGDHSWATLPTFVPGNLEERDAPPERVPFAYSAKVAELLQGAIESTDNTSRTARLRQALEAFEVQ